LEEDQLNPNGRILIGVGLTIIVGMSIETGIISIALGGSPISLSGGLIAYPVGTLCGIAKRGLAAAVGRKSEDFVGLAAPRGGNQHSVS